jgi:hypothetical protein
MGYKAKALSRHAIALGAQNIANGENSVALGYYNTTYNQGEIALGTNNYSEIDITMFSIGNGDPIGAKKNVLTITNNGINNIFIAGIGNYNGTDPYANENIKSL